MRNWLLVLYLYNLLKLLKNKDFLKTSINIYLIKPHMYIMCIHTIIVIKENKDIYFKLKNNVNY